jgi:acyl-homoserine lactone acylase PvdQ
VLTGISDLTLDKLIEAAYDPYLPGFEKLIPGLIEAHDEADQPGAELAEPIDVLRNWDMTVSRDSVAMTLAHFYGMRYVEEGANDQKLRGMERIDFFGTQSPPAERLHIFAETLQMLTQDFGDWNTPWGEVNRFQRLNGDIDLPFDDGKPSLPVGMASGNWGALAAFGAKRFDDTRRIYGYRGNSFVAVVEFGAKVKAKSLLAGGQSNDPASPHFDDQAERFVNREFKDVAYYREDVERRAQRQYRPGER